MPAPLGASVPSRPVFFSNIQTGGRLPGRQPVQNAHRRYQPGSLPERAVLAASRQQRRFCQNPGGRDDQQASRFPFVQQPAAQRFPPHRGFPAPRAHKGSQSAQRFHLPILPQNPARWPPGSVTYPSRSSCPRACRRMAKHRRSNFANLSFAYRHAKLPILFPRKSGHAVLHAIAASRATATTGCGDCLKRLAELRPANKGRNVFRQLLIQTAPPQVPPTPVRQSHLLRGRP